MLVVRLKEMLEEYRHRTGIHLSMEGLAARLGMGVSTLFGIAQPGHSTTLHTIERIARALEMGALDLLEEVPDAPAGAARPKVGPASRQAKRPKKQQA